MLSRILCRRVVKGKINLYIHSLLLKTFMKTILLAALCLLPCACLYAQESKPAIDITPLTGDFYVSRSWIPFGKAIFPCNSIYVVTSKGVVLINTPPDEEQTGQLLDSIEKRHGQKVVLCIATHFHKDGT